MQLILAGETAQSITTHRLNKQLLELLSIFKDQFCQEQLSLANDAVVQGKFYSALKSLKPLLPIERELLSHQVC